MELLPEDLFGDILHRLPERDLATARCVHTSWRATIDSRRLMHLLPTLPLAGIFLTFNDHDLSEFLARPTPPSATTAVSGKLHQYMPANIIAPVEDHCNGLLLLGCGAYACVVNPATHRWAALPSPRPPCPFSREGFCLYDYIAFDPAVSPHYEVVEVPHLRNKGSRNAKPPEVKVEVEWFEWPPSPMMLSVFSSATNRWEKRPFVRQGEALGTVAEVQAPWPGDQEYGVYWRGHLYVHHVFVMRVSLSRGKYRAIKPPHDMYGSGAQDRSLGRSEKGVYLASIASSENQLRVWILDESSFAQTKWVLTYQVDLAHILTHRSYNPQACGSAWVLEDVNYHFYGDIIPGYSGEAPPPGDRLEWDSDDDDDDVLAATKDMMIGGRYEKDISILGFHPHKEILFLSESMRRGLAYHLNTSKLHDLGDMYPTRYDFFADYHRLLSYSYPYTPCWTSEFPSNN